MFYDWIKVFEMQNNQNPISFVYLTNQLYIFF